MLALESIIPALNRGDAEAWRRLVREHSPALFRYLRAQVRDDDAAAELTQQTFVRMLRTRLKPGYSLRALAFRIATNLLRDEQRSRAARQRREQEAAMPEAVNHDPARKAIAAETWERALALPDELRQIVLLRYGQGFTAAETAAVLGIPEGTVKTRQRKALESLRGSALAAPTLVALEGDLHAAASATPIPATLTTDVEAIIMASIGTKTGFNLAVLVAAALLLIGGFGVASFFLFGGPDSPRHGPSLPDAGATAAAPPSSEPSTEHPPARYESNHPGADDGGATRQPDEAAPEQPEADPQPPAEERNPPAEDDTAAGEETADTPEAEAETVPTWVISGRVLDTSGQGISGAVVTATVFARGTRDGNPDTQVGPFAVQQTWKSDVDGSYRAKISLDLGWDVKSLEATMSATAFAMAPQAVVPIEPLKAGAEREGVDITLVAGGSISGVVRTETGEPLQGAIVFAILRGGKTYGGDRAASIVGADYSIRTDKEGRYTIPAIKEGTWYISVVATGHGGMKGNPLEVAVVGGRETAAADVILGGAVPVKMRLVNEQGAPLKPSGDKPLWVVVRMQQPKIGPLLTGGPVDSSGILALPGVRLETEFLVIELEEQMLSSDPVHISLVPGGENDIGDVTMIRRRRQSGG